MEAILLLLCSVFYVILGFEDKVEVVTEATPVPRLGLPPLITAGSGFGAWTPWGPCTVTCGEGRRARIRRCERGPCQADINRLFQSQETTCLIRDCGVESAGKQMREKWEEWTEWTDCSVSCGGGQRSRESRCIGEGCKFPGVNQFIDCNLVRCPDT